MRTPKVTGAIVAITLLTTLLTACVSACASTNSSGCEPTANTWTVHMKFDWQGIDPPIANFLVSDNQHGIFRPSRWTTKTVKNIKPHIPFQVDVNILPDGEARISDPHFVECDVWVTDSHGRTLKGLRGNGHVRRRSNFHPQQAECILSFQQFPGIG